MRPARVVCLLLLRIPEPGAKFAAQCRVVHHNLPSIQSSYSRFRLRLGTVLHVGVLALPVPVRGEPAVLDVAEYLERALQAHAIGVLRNAGRDVDHEGVQTTHAGAWSTFLSIVRLASTFTVGAVVGHIDVFDFEVLLFL